MPPHFPTPSRTAEPFMGYLHQLLVEWNRRRQMAQHCQACRRCKIDFHLLAYCLVVLTVLCVILASLMVYKRRLRSRYFKVKPE